LSFLRRLKRVLGLSPTGDDPDPGVGAGSPAGPPAPIPPEELRRRIEDVLARDDAGTLAELLSPRREEGKVLIRTWEREIATAGTDTEREALARRITALVAIYAKAFDDPEPLEHFRRQAPPGRRAGAAMHEAQQAFRAGDLATADARAADGLAALDEIADAPPDPDRSALESSLLSVRGGVAAREERWDDAGDLFERALGEARASGHRESLSAALLNLLDLHTRRSRFADAEPLLDEARRAVEGGPYVDVLGKLLVERGVGQARAGELEGASATFDRAVELKPDWPFPWYQRGWVRFLSGDSGGALDDYRECASRRAVFFTVQREIRCLEDVAAGLLPIEAYRSFCAIRDRVRDQPDEVEDAARKMNERWPDFAPGWLLLAETRLAHSDPGGAREAAHEALRHDPDPDTASAALFLEWNVARKENDEESREEAEERLEKAYPESAAAHLVRKIRQVGGRDVALRWTFGLDGTLQLEEVTPPDRNPPAPGSPG
jgi:tetratricopeptide (TPR) repeat protein